MDRETLTHVFEPFYTTKKSGQGTGLGLATVYGIVKQSRGALSVYSEPGRGSTFKVYFPQAEGLPTRRPKPADQPESEGGLETILVAEDEEAVRELVRTVLVRLGYRVLVAADGLEAVEVATREQLDLLLTDVIMPGLSGPETATRVRELQPKVRILFMSGYTAGAIDRHSLLEQDAALLQKPFTPGLLASTVRMALVGATPARSSLPLPNRRTSSPTRCARDPNSGPSSGRATARSRSRPRHPTRPRRPGSADSPIRSADVSTRVTPALLACLRKQ